MWVLPCMRQVQRVLYTWGWISCFSWVQASIELTAVWKWNSFHFKGKIWKEITFEKCWWNVTFPHNNFLAFMTKILCYLQLPANATNWQGRDINISLSSEGAVSQVRQKQWAFGTPHPSVESNFLLQVSLSSEKWNILQGLDINNVQKTRETLQWCLHLLLLANVLLSRLGQKILTTEARLHTSDDLEGVMLPMVSHIHAVWDLWVF